MSTVRVLIFCFLIFNSQFICGQKENFLTWNNLVLADSTQVPFVADTMTIIYSSRKLINDSTKFMSDNLSLGGEPTVFLAVCKNLKWTFFPVNNLQIAMNYFPKSKSWVYYVEGFGKTFPIAHYRAAGLSTQYNVNVVMFDFPTYDDTKNLISNYYLAEKNAISCSRNFSDFLIDVEKAKREVAELCVDCQHTLFIHSMGNIVLKAAIEQEYIANKKVVLFDKVVLNNPCVPSKQHHIWTDKIYFTKNVVIHHNKQDRQLLAATLFQRTLMLGKITKTGKSTQSIYVDFNALMGNKHNAFLNKPGYTNVPDQAQEYYYSLFTKSIAETVNSSCVVKLSPNAYRICAFK